MDKQRVGGSDANPIYRVTETAGAQQRDKYVVGDTGVAFDTLEAAEAAARELDTLTPPRP
ncbi:hypothetical protein P6166_07950 [Stenotrophomonas sp. HITSZ_GD]|uniref:hypothetical protein n=1 Tax=Stenotrophomonas sp. HITSZ_GD TaxID=3037248 RepID=UPI00240E7904|nr:hypothetical protein [Stenotrophomonas sp. HITSZ_GD]MDG2525284.1 hypothetical protein [Stenotrophomonas sp. HITSZ_GD]